MRVRAFDYFTNQKKSYEKQTLTKFRPAILESISHAAGHHVKYGNQPLFLTEVDDRSTSRRVSALMVLDPSVGTPDAERLNVPPQSAPKWILGAALLAWQKAGQ